MKKRLIFLDIDGTLIQPNQEPNTDELPELIEELDQEGFLFGLNSNRSLEDIRDIYLGFNLNGPVVLENGVYFKKELGGEEIFLTDNVIEITPHIQNAIVKYCEQNDLKAEVHVADTVEIIKHKNLEEIPLAIFINQFRKYTASVHLFRHGRRDKDLAQDMTKFIKNYAEKNNLPIEVESPKTFGNIIAWPKNTSKGTALEKLKEYYPEYRFYMIGDDPADLTTLSEIDSFFAVGNAEEEVKDPAEYVAEEEYTKGVVEILEYLRDR